MLFLKIFLCNLFYYYSFYFLGNKRWVLQNAVTVLFSKFRGNFLLKKVISNIMIIIAAI